MVPVRRLDNAVAGWTNAVEKLHLPARSMNHRREAMDAFAPLNRKRGIEVTPRLYSSRDLTRATLSVGAIGALLFSTAYIVRPFVSAFIWATMIVLSTWPLLIGLQARLWGKRGLATLVMTLAL